MPLRIGSVSYLNSAPVNAGLDALPDAELSLAVPSALADQLAAGDLDAALIPVFEALKNPRYRIVPDVSISCRGSVQSVKLFCRRSIQDVRSVALDPSSRTSAALTRILLETRRGLRPDYKVGIDPNADAQLLIGDPALGYAGDFVDEIDLGQDWMRAAGLPFVFAVWAARPSAATPTLARLLQEAKRAGAEQIDEIARREAKRRGLPESTARFYLTRSIEYDLNHDHVAGLKWFAHLAAEIGLLEKAPDIDRMLIF